MFGLGSKKKERGRKHARAHERFLAPLKSPGSTCLLHPRAAPSPKLIPPSTSSRRGSLSHPSAHCLPRSLNSRGPSDLHGTETKGQAAAGREGGRAGESLRQASPGGGRDSSASLALGGCQQASHPPIWAPPSPSCVSRSYLSHQPSPTSHHPLSHLQPEPGSSLGSR